MNHFTKALIVDDELQSRALIRKLLSNNFPDFTTDEAETVDEAVSKIRGYNPDLVFLDVQMRGETGFDLLDKLKDLRFSIIFTTAHSEFAVKAFKYSALDYLIKPISSTEFTDSVEKFLKNAKSSIGTSAGQVEILQKLKSQYAVPDKLTIPSSDGFLIVNVKDILYCNAISNYTEFIMAGNKKITSSYTLGYYTELLENHNFFRVHRSHLVNLSCITMYKRGDGGLVVMSNGEEIEVSRSNKEAFLKIFKV